MEETATFLEKLKKAFDVIKNKIAESGAVRRSVLPENDSPASEDTVYYEEEPVHFHGYEDENYGYGWPYSDEQEDDVEEEICVEPIIVDKIYNRLNLDTVVKMITDLKTTGNTIFTVLTVVWKLETLTAFSNARTVRGTSKAV